MKLLPNADLTYLSDEEYLLHRAKEEQNQDPYAAKSWLITAQTIFPKNFGIQFEIYKIAKDEKNAKEAAKCLSSLFQVFHHEASLWAEVDDIMASLCNGNTPSSSSLSSSSQQNNVFLAKIFKNLAKEVQKAMVIAAAERSKDTMTYCSLMILFTSNFPESTAYNGLKLVDALIKAEKQNQGPLNPFRQKLVCELLPRLLQAEGLEVRPKVLYHLLTKAVEFYIAYVTTPYKIAQGLLQNELSIEDPWHELFSAVRLIGWNLGWELAAEFDNIDNREVILQRIQSMVESGARLGAKGDNGEDVREILYKTVVIFLHSLLDYTRRLYPDFTHGENLSNYPPPLTLIQAFVVNEKEGGVSIGSPSGSSSALIPSPLKRHRPSLEDDQANALITVSRLTLPPSTPCSVTQSAGESLIAAANPAVSASHHITVSSTALSKALVTAIKCWDLLHAYEQLRSEFVRLLEGLHIERWLMIFSMDVLIYEGRLAEAERQLRHSLTRARQVPSSSGSPITLLTLNLKLASVLFALNKFSSAAECALECVDQLTPLSTQGGLTHNLGVNAPTSKRHLHLLALTRPQSLQFIVTLLIEALRHRIIVEGNTDDHCIGHLVVLLQYEWPRHESILEEVIKAIKKKGSFTYQYFGSYVTLPEILEEFMYLATNHEGSICLDILTLPHTSKQRMSTRGADRGSRQDFRVAMKRQMLRCFESVEANVVAFLTRQDAFIPHVFM